MAQEADGVRLPTLASKPFTALSRVHLRVPTRKQLSAITADTRFVLAVVLVLTMLLVGLLLQTRTAH
jgi:hypothetical protein